MGLETLPHGLVIYMLRPEHGGKILQTADEWSCAVVICGTLEPVCSLVPEETQKCWCPQSVQTSSLPTFQMKVGGRLYVSMGQ